ncbi:accessory factor UbiK family protein [Rickettsiales endosymbiont of Stachyamoeba lipophora]|uniref:accessory factor UbiK family protein n=1 Tax=Rickettsiales endosymbiont of Stachyamoeba lipophora TaxID=2486578 RepID=UPI000F655FF1|nr:accessory factor UbiK family protein [Rickettsiales endosymbiont of Stachyamoeba lipophora]AZL16044.1 accessory factor UbiK family protein [Rickettsiales endosymbiont of Stachyamoeba lipophora]
MSNNKFFEEFQRLGASAFNTFVGSAKHFEEMLKNMVESFLLKMDLVKKDDLMATQEMIKLALEKIANLEQQIIKLQEGEHTSATSEESIKKKSPKSSKK